MFEGMEKSSGKTREPDCYCHTCERDFHHLGIMSHRAAHRNRKETCVIEYSTGKTIKHNFGEEK